jgi:glycosyltransferase involved in cell wall biosynthesis
MSGILFLTARMLQGYGVALAVHNLALQLKQRGHRISVFCPESDGSFHGYPIERQPVRVEIVEAYARATKAQVIVAHTSPFYEMLPALRARYRVFAWEYGDPPPELFPDAALRSADKESKLKSVYPFVDGVVAISKFIAHDCDWPQAKIIYCGCDHVPDLGLKTGPSWEAETGRATLRLGALMRMGQGEALYKGNESYRELCRRLRQDGVQVECQVMGRGTPADAEDFERAGIHVHLNASDAEKAQYLRELDVFVSLSRWEGFNLPLVEAEASGTVGLALNLGAHPEVTPFVFGQLEDVQAFIVSCDKDRGTLSKRAAEAYQYVRTHFAWSNAVDEWLAWTGLPRHSDDFRPSLTWIERLSMVIAISIVKLREHGALTFCSTILRKTIRRTSKLFGFQSNTP